MNPQPEKGGLRPSGFIISRHRANLNPAIACQQVLIIGGSFGQGKRILFFRKNRHFAVSLGCLIRGYTDGIPVKPLNDAIKTALSECSFRRPCIHG
jgi:hypothetical protein